VQCDPIADGEQEVGMGELCERIEAPRGKVVDAPVTVANHCGDFADAYLCAICEIQRASRMMVYRGNREDDCAKNRREPVVERAIYEDGP